jgi:hypothetical protein
VNRSFKPAYVPRLPEAMGSSPPRATARRTRRRGSSWVFFVSCDVVRRGTLACGARLRLRSSLAGGSVTLRVGDASHPPRPQKRTRTTRRRGHLSIPCSLFSVSYFLFRTQSGPSPTPPEADADDSTPLRRSRRGARSQTSLKPVLQIADCVRLQMEVLHVLVA